ncbi:hypothetical protein PVAP13_5NG145005, partial [Panicum virgatum]
DDEGWQTVVSRRTHKELRRLERRPRRPVPADLRGKWFNCFSPRHRAAACTLAARCFHCRELGHRAHDCSVRSTTPSGRAPRLVWRPVSRVAAPPSTMATSPAAVPPSTGDVAGQGRHRRRSRKRRGRRDAPSPPPPQLPEDSGDSPASTSGADERPVDDGGRPRRPQRVIARSTAISQREERLAERALVLSVIADDPGGHAEFIVPAIAQRFEIEENLLSLHSFGSANFLLISPDEQLATRIFNNGRPLVFPPVRLHVMRWSRFLHSEAAFFSSAMDVELRGIPAHAWDLETVAQLLGDNCIPCGLPPETTTNRKVYRLTAWCSSPSSILPEVDL